MLGGHVGDVPLPRPVVIPSALGEARQFYVRMAYACAAVAFVGFTPTYWAPVATRAFSGPPILHLHGLLFSAWTVLFIVQARLAASGNLRRHRALGLAGVSLATAMLFAGFAVAIASMRTGLAAGSTHARDFSIVPLTIVGSFAALVAAALVYARRSDVHMRLMLVATITILPPAVARLLRLTLARPGDAAGLMGNPPPVPLSLVPNGLADLLLVVAMVHDWRTNGRVHRAYIVAGACVVLVQIARVPFSTTDVWRSIADWLMAFTG